MMIEVDQTGFFRPHNVQKREQRRVEALRAAEQAKAQCVAEAKRVAEEKARYLQLSKRSISLAGKETGPKEPNADQAFVAKVIVERLKECQVCSHSRHGNLNFQ
jgi:hypothetical protein